MNSITEHALAISAGLFVLAIIFSAIGYTERKKLNAFKSRDIQIFLVDHGGDKPEVVLWRVQELRCLDAMCVPTNSQESSTLSGFQIIVKESGFHADDTIPLYSNLITNGDADDED